MQLMVAQIGSTPTRDQPVWVPQGASQALISSRAPKRWIQRQQLVPSSTGEAKTFSQKQYGENKKGFDQRGGIRKSRYLSWMRCWCFATRRGIPTSFDQLFFSMATPVPTRRAKDSSETFLIGLQREFDNAVAQRIPYSMPPEEARWDAVEALAHTLASKRKGDLPRLGRQHLAERRSGMALAVGLVLGVDEATNRIETDAPHTERLIGIDRARRFKPDSVEPWLTSPPGEGLAHFAQTANLQRMIDLIRVSSDEDFEMARNSGRAMVKSIAALSKLADAVVGRSNAAGMAGITALLDDPYLGTMMPGFILSVRTLSEDGRLLDQALEAISGAVAPIRTAVMEFDALQPEQRAERLEAIGSLPFAESLKARRILEQFSEHPPRSD